MAAAAHTPGGYGGVPQSVGREFNAADAGHPLLKRANARAHVLKRGAKRGRDGAASSGIAGKQSRDAAGDNDSD